MEIDYYSIKKKAGIYFLFPAIIFAFGYLRFPYALLVAVSETVCVILFLRKSNTTEDKAESIEISCQELVIFLLICIVWAALGGLYGLGYQTSDWDMRNSLCHDLVTHPWPVIYEGKNTALCYYIGFWMVPAAVGKLAGLFWGEAIAFRVARVMVGVVASIGLFIIILLLNVYFQTHTKRERTIVLLMFVFFSGMDIIGVLITHYWEAFSPDLMHLEWWTGYQYTSLTACIYWVFNQTIIPWMVTLCFLMEKDSRNYVFLASACILCGPLPLIGLAAYMVTREIARIIGCIKGRKRKKEVLESLFSVSNLVCLLGVCPMLCAYIMSNDAFTRGVSIGKEASKAAANQITGFWPSSWYPLKNENTVFFVLFSVFLEVGVYLILLWKDYHKDLLYQMVLLSLIIIPFIHVGNAQDFCMRASVPGVFIVMLLCTDYMLRRFGSREAVHTNGRTKGLRTVILCICLCIGAATPGMELWRGIYKVASERTIHQAVLSPGTLDETEPSINFESTGYQDKFFFKYLAKSTE